MTVGADTDWEDLAMTTNASEALGAVEIAGSFVSPKGLTKRMTGRTAGHVVGGMIGDTVATVATAGNPGAPPFGTIGYVAVTADDIAIVRGKTGLMKPSVGSEIIARVPRSAIGSIELDKGMLKAALKIGFTDGNEWEFEVPKIYRKTAEQVVETLRERLSA